MSNVVIKNSICKPALHCGVANAAVSTRAAQIVPIMQIIITRERSHITYVALGFC